MSYSLTIFVMALVFSVLVPYVNFFAMAFFGMKYYVDKYNLTFNYNPEFLSVGTILYRVIPLSHINIIIYQIINVGFFASKSKNGSKKYIYVGLAIVAIEIALIASKYYSVRRKNKRIHTEMRTRQISLLKNNQS